MTKAVSASSATGIAAVVTVAQPTEWLRDYFGPCVCVLASDGAETVCAKNNLTLAELLQPFSRLTQDINVRDPEGANTALSALAVNFTDFRRDPARLINAKLMSDLVADSQASVTDSSGENIISRGQVEAPSQSPWYDTWAKLYAHSVPQSEHEYCRHHVAVVLATSSSAKDPVADLRTLVERQQRHHQDQAVNWPQFLQPVVLRVYVLVHDAYEAGGDAKAQEQLARMRTAFGTGACHLLQINSRPEGQNEAQSPSAHWFSPTHRFLNADARREGMGATVITTAETAAANTNHHHHNDSQNNSNAASTIKEEGNKVSHPLHPLAVEETRRSPSPPIPTATNNPRQLLSPTTPANVAARLTSNDVDRIRIFVRE